MCFIFQHNALRAICPATVNIVMGIVSHAKANTDVRHTAIHCFVMMVQLLNRCSPDQVSVCVYSEATESSLEACHFHPTAVSFSHPLCHINQPKALVTTEGYHMVMTTKICVNAMAR
jgi:hypothetical protein